MTLEERMARLEQRANISHTKGQVLQIARIAELDKRMDELEAKLGELDVMILAIHSAIKDVQERV